MVHLFAPNLCQEKLSIDHQLTDLKTKTISSEIAYSNQSTRTLTTTPLKTNIEANATSG